MATSQPNLVKRGQQVVKVAQLQPASGQLVLVLMPTCTPPNCHKLALPMKTA